ncbi:MAG TPA: tripartite tricarboxylate transporter substrate binding protein [Burkholderiaceae bacterium]|nr:tripartite tricarboxylate transporter substrate binding protein [Burkholderiaceae bacterium]
MDRRQHLGALLGTAALAAAPRLAASQTSFDRPLRVIVPFSAGALTDVIARLYAEKLSTRIGQSVIVENKPGAAGVIASQALLALPADGHALMAVSSSHAVNPSLHERLPYDTLNDFAGVALVAASPCVVIVNPSLGVKTMAELVALAKSKPGSLTYGSAGNGAATHLVAEYFAKETGTRWVHVPYKGVQEAVAEVVAGRIDAAFPPIALAAPMIRGNRLLALALTGTERNEQLAGVPTVAESGAPGFDYRIWYAFVAAAKSPRPVVERIAAELRAITGLPDVREKMVSQGLTPTVVTLGEFDGYIRTEIDKLGRIVRGSNIRQGG